MLPCDDFHDADVAAFDRTPGFPVDDFSRRSVMQILKQLSWLVCSMIIVTSMTNEAFAQRGGGRGPQTRTRYELATLPEVQGDLKLNDEQKKLATDLLAKQREKTTVVRSGRRCAGDPNRDDKTQCRV